MKTLSKEIFCVYWNGKIQPCGVSFEAVKEYIFNSLNSGFATKKQFKIKSNYRDNINF